MDETTIPKNHKHLFQGCSWGCVVKVFLCLLLAGIIWDTWLKPPVIWYWNVAGVDLWIPRDYFEPKFVNASEEDFGLAVRHDDFSAVNMKNRSNTDINIGIANPKYYKPIDESFKLYMGSFETQLNKGQQFGLTYFTKKPGNPKRWGEIWLEKSGERIESFITCSQDMPFDQCTQNFMYGPLHIVVWYDKRLLPEWKKIEEKTIQLIESFKIKPTGYLSIKIMHPSQQPPAF